MGEGIEETGLRGFGEMLEVQLLVGEWITFEILRAVMTDLHVH